MPKLNINIDHVATLRQARMGREPDPVAAAMLAELSGAHGIVAHLREDRRHIQERDLRLLRETVTTRLNMEMAPTPEMVKIALDLTPDMVTLVPEKRAELTTEGGLDVKSNLKAVRKATDALRGGGILVSLFIDPDIVQIEQAIVVGADMCEIHTGRYAGAPGERERAREHAQIIKAADFVHEGGMRVSAGHGLDYHNVFPIAEIEGIEELNIGHSIISRSVLVGIERAVVDMLDLCA